MNYTEWLDHNHILIPENARSSIGLLPTDIVIVFCGRLVWQKNPKLLLDAFINILPMIPNAKLIFLGDGHMKNELEGIADAKKLWKKSVHFLGNISGQRKLEWYRTCDCVVVPSFNEPFGLIVLECLISKRPVFIANNISPAEFLIDQQHCVKFEPIIEDLTFKLQSSLKNKTLMNYIGETGYNYVLNNFNDKSMAQKLEVIYETLYKKEILIEETDDFYF